MDWLTDNLLDILEILLPSLVVAFLVILIPAKHNKTPGEPHATYKKLPPLNTKRRLIWYALYLIFFYIFIPALAYPFAVLFESINSHLEKPFSDALIIQTPTFWSFYALSLLLLYAICCNLSATFLKIIFREKYEEFQQEIAFSESTTGVDHKKFAKGLFVFLIIAIVIILFLLIKSHTYFYADKVKFFDFSAWETVNYHYNDISKIIHVGGYFDNVGQLHKDEHYRIYFKDNNYWSSLTWNDLNEDTINAIKLVSEKTKKIIEEIPGI